MSTQTLPCVAEPSPAEEDVRTANEALEKAEQTISERVNDVEKCMQELDRAHEVYDEQPVVDRLFTLADAIAKSTAALEKAQEAELEARLAGDRAYEAASIAKEKCELLKFASTECCDTEPCLAQAFKTADEASATALRMLNECTNMTDMCKRALEVAEKNHYDAPIGVSLFDHVLGCQASLECAQDAETEARVVYCEKRRTALAAKRKWERFVSSRGAEFRRRVRSFGGETVKIPDHLLSSHDEMSEILGYSPTSPSYTPDHSPPPLERPPSVDGAPENAP